MKCECVWFGSSPYQKETASGAKHVTRTRDNGCISDTEARKSLSMEMQKCSVK